MKRTRIPLSAQAAAMMLAIGVLDACAPAMPGEVHTAAASQTEAPNLSQLPLHPEARPYAKGADATAAIDAALARAAASDKRVIVVLGANWCHDSRGLAGWFETPRFAAMLKPRYEIVYVDAGDPGQGEPANAQIAARLGMDEQTGTPAVFVLDADGQRLNSLKDAASWRNSASREPDAIYDYFANFPGTAS